MNLHDARLRRAKAYDLKVAADALWVAYEDLCREIERDEPDRAEKLLRAEERVQVALGEVRRVVTTWV